MGFSEKLKIGAGAGLFLLALSFIGDEVFAQYDPVYGDYGKIPENLSDIQDRNPRYSIKHYDSDGDGLHETMYLMSPHIKFSDLISPDVAVSSTTIEDINDDYPYDGFKTERVVIIYK